jgi:hypothetical protein
MESVAIVTSLVVAAAVVMITYLYASGATPPSINVIIEWFVAVFQRGLNTLAALVGSEPLFPVVRQMGSAAGPVVSGAAGGLEAGVRSVEDVLAGAEQAVAATVTPGGGIGGAGPGIAGDPASAPLDAGVDSSLGFCYVGQSHAGRVCAPVSRPSGCMSGENFGSLEQCRLNGGARLGSKSHSPPTGAPGPSIGALL